MLAEGFENNDSNKKAESHQSAHEENDEEYEKNIKIKILDASVKFVPDMGWSKRAISAGTIFHILQLYMYYKKFKSIFLSAYNASLSWLFTCHQFNKTEIKSDI